jgi:drug/metabolite transporter (DMT)-like permease
VTSPAAIAYALCAAVSAAIALLLLRSWLRRRSAFTAALGYGFAILTISNSLLIVDLFHPADLSLLRAVVVALGLGVLVYGLERASR